MDSKVGLLNDELREALVHISGKPLEGTFQTTAEMLHAFNSNYVCKTTFTVVDADGAPLEGATVTVKSGDTVIDAQADGTFNVDSGTYTYDCTCEGYTDITGKTLTIAESDVTKGTKTVTVAMTAAE